MLLRRRFFASTSAAIAAPLATSLLSACGGSYAADTVDVPVSDDELKHQMIGRLASQLGDEQIASVITPYVLNFSMTWKPITAPVSSLQTIVAYGFGNRPNSNSGNTPTDGSNQTALPDPGPVNEALADTVAKVYAQNPVKIYAQWEIARFLESKHKLSNVVSIEPVIADDGTITYLSTDGVAAKIVELEQNDAASMGTVGIIGFRDHVKRCVLTSQGRGMQAFAPDGIEMPGDYDTESGQAWTRSRKLYLVHDMYAQIATLRAKLIAADYPNG